MDLLCIRMFILSINPIAIIGPISNISRKVEAKNRNRIRDKVDPCRIPVIYSLFLSTNVPSRSCIVLSYKNNARY